MTAVTTETHDHHSEGHDHPNDLLYWKVGLGLAVLTALEVSTYWWPHGWHKITHTLLIVMMVIKFVVVASFFMHLKFDSKVLTRLFYAGLFTAVAVYMAALTSMTYWWDDGGAKSFINAPRLKPEPPKPTNPPPPTVAGGH